MMHLRERMTRNCQQVRIPGAWRAIDLRQCLSSRLFSFTLPEKQGKGVWLQQFFTSTFLNSFLFSELPMMLPNFLNHYVIPQALDGQVDNQKRFREYSYPLVCFAAFWIRG